MGLALTSLLMWEAEYVFLFLFETKVSPHKAYFQRLKSFLKYSLVSFKNLSFILQLFIISSPFPSFLFSSFSFRRVPEFHFISTTCKLTPKSLTWMRLTQVQISLRVWILQSSSLCPTLRTPLLKCLPWRKRLRCAGQMARGGPFLTLQSLK